MLNWPSWVPFNPAPSTWATFLVPAATIYFAWQYVRPTSPSRQRVIRPTDERVVIVGASSGLGRVVAKRYAARGANVCVVARRAEQLAELAGECGEKCFWVAADFSDVGDMVRAREELFVKWGGLDTLYVCAGVSAVQPVMSLAGVEPGKNDDAGDAGMRHAVDIAARATQGNVYGPLVAALTFIPMLLRTSTSPSILLISSIAAVIPAPTRALYAATKASSLLLYQSLAIEHPKIAFTFVLPATIQGNFRASAVDADVTAREEGPNERGLKLDYVADRCVGAVDRRVRGNVVIPKFPYAIAHHIYYLWPSFIEKQARKKYNFK